MRRPPSAARCRRSIVARNRSSDQFTLYEPCERRNSERRRAVGIADEIVRALNDRRMMLALQPIVTSKSREPELYECLLRMQRLDGTIAWPRDFIPVAEQFGLIKLVDHRALELAIELLRTLPNIKLALNVSAATATDPQWLAGLEASIGQGPVPHRATHVEITETRRHLRFAGERAIRGRAQGARLPRGARRFRRWLHLVPQVSGLLGVDMVKIDGSFIQNLGTQAEDELFVRTLIELAKNFGITTVGEWVGDEKTARILENAGVAYMQGYFFGAPELALPAQAESRPA